MKNNFRLVIKMDLQKGSKAPLLTDNEDKGDEERGHAQID